MKHGPGIQGPATRGTSLRPPRIALYGQKLYRGFESPLSARYLQSHHLAFTESGVVLSSWIWRPSFERQRDFNPPEQRAAQRALPEG